MKAEQAKKMADEALEQLEASLKSGRSESLTAYLSMMARFHHYSFGNIMLIAMQRPSATHVAGFNTWKQLKRYVKAGEKGIAIIAPMVIHKKSDESEHVAVEADAESFLRFKAVYVFDISQTDGEPLPVLHRVGGNPNGHAERLKSLIIAKGITLEYADDLNGADGSSHGGTITVRQGLPPAEEFSVLVHELAHEMLHKVDGIDRPGKSVRETEAEAVAFVVTQGIGLDVNTAAVDYIQLYGGCKDTLAASLNRIQHTATEILSGISAEQ